MTLAIGASVPITKLDPVAWLDLVAVLIAELPQPVA
jgi:hypothetical protein